MRPGDTGCVKDNIACGICERYWGMCMTSSRSFEKGCRAVEGGSVTCERGRGNAREALTAVRRALERCHKFCDREDQSLQ